MKARFIGAGQMGGPMAANLASTYKVQLIVEMMRTVALRKDLR